MPIGVLSSYMEFAVRAGISQILYYTSSDCDEVAKVNCVKLLWL